jgi:hypothetical protein
MHCPALPDRSHIHADLVFTSSVVLPHLPPLGQVNESALPRKERLSDGYDGTC